MKTITLLLLLLMQAYCSSAQAPYVFTEFVNDSFRISSPENFHIYKGRLYFSADGLRYFTEGSELWSTDGTLAGTYQVKEINNGSTTAGSNPGGFAEVNGKLVFAATNEIQGRELWVTDGTEAGTKLLKDISPGIFDSRPYGFTLLNDELIFIANDSQSRAEIWKTDGTTDGTILLKKIDPGRSGHSSSFFTHYNGKLYFAATDTNGTELWETDGTDAGTKMFLDINPGFRSSFPFAFTELSGKLYFIAKTDQNWPQLWVTDGTETGTYMVKHIAEGLLSSFNNNIPRKFTVYNNKLYFSTSDLANTAGLWCSDGTDTGTYMLKDIVLNWDWYGAMEEHIVYNDKLYFTAIDDTYGKELWVTDGTTSGTQLVSDLLSGSMSSFTTNLILFNNHIFYRARVSNSPDSFQLVKTDGTAAGTRVILNSKADQPKPLSPTYEFIVYDSTLYFAANYKDYNFGYSKELWSLKDTTGSFKEVIDTGTQYNNNNNFWLILYPSPGNGEFFLESNDTNFIGSQVSIYDMLGRRIYIAITDAQKIKFDISYVAQGVYTLKLYLNGEVFTRRFVKYE